MAKKNGNGKTTPEASTPAQDVVDAIRAANAAGQKTWFQVHGAVHAEAIRLLKAEGVIKWNGGLDGYQFTNEQKGMERQQEKRPG